MNATPAISPSAALQGTLTMYNAIDCLACGAEIPLSHPVDQPVHCASCHAAFAVFAVRGGCQIIPIPKVIPVIDPPPGAVGASAAPAPGDSHVSGLQIAADLALSAITNFAYFVAAAQPGELRSSDALRAARDIERAARRMVDTLADPSVPSCLSASAPLRETPSSRRSAK